MPLIFWKIGWTHHPRLTVLAAGVGGSAGGDGRSWATECEAGIEEAVSCVNGRKIGHSKKRSYKNTKIENLDERKGKKHESENSQHDRQSDA